MTTPKLEPAPRSAQKRPGFSSADTVIILRVAVTSLRDTSESEGIPWRLWRLFTPAANVAPTMATHETEVVLLDAYKIKVSGKFARGADTN